MNLRAWSGALLLAGCVAGPMALAAAPALKAEKPPSAEGLELFEREIRPLLVAECQSCHGPKLQQGDLRLTDRAALLKGGSKGPGVVPGDPDRSLLLKAVRHEGLKMPPAKRLPERQAAAVERWIRLGAPWPAERAAGAPVLGDQSRIFREAQRHWAYQPARRPAVPPVKNAKWLKNPVDAFILARLEKAGLTPAPAADRRTLIRRVTYDLIGLPPTPEEVDAFISDRSPDAYEKVVDRLLASPHYGERWGRHWLDVARYADTKDGVLMFGDSRIRPYAYTYRDYVIRAFNEDTPYDQFLREQLAADQVQPPVATWRLAAMGFLTLGRQFDNNIHDVIDDRIDTVGRGLLGLTLACARCHDHKYDAVPIADYYSLYGVFASCEAPVELPQIEPGEKLPGYAEFQAKFNPKKQQLEKLVDEQYAQLSETARTRVADYLVHVVTTPPDPLETAVFFLSLSPEDLRPQIVARWRRLLEKRATAADPVFGPWKELMELPEAELAARAPEVLARWKARKPGTGPGEVNPAVLQALLGAKLTDRKSVAQAYGSALLAVYREAAANSPLGPEKKQLLDLVSGRDAPAYFPKTQTYYYLNRGEKDAYGGLKNELDVIAVQSPGAPPRAMVLTDNAEPHEPRIFQRGNASAPGDLVPRQFLKLLSGPSRRPFTRGSGRLELANAIADPKNPLTARVLVNRVWMHHFGEPLVPTPGDFGSRSTPPTHPELLDYLASVFSSPGGSVEARQYGSKEVKVASSSPVRARFHTSTLPHSQPGLGWSLKKLHRLLVTSSAYRMTSDPRAGRIASSNPQSAIRNPQSKDPENRLLWRAHRRRLDFEQMRDTLLAASGRLDRTMFGRPVREAVDPGSNRRTVYCLVDRQSLPEVFRAFNFAQPDQSVERRPSTTVPQQALFALNSPFVVEQAKALLSLPEVKAAASDEARVAALYRRILQRAPRAGELATGLAFVRRPALVGAEASKLTPWEQYAQVLLQTNEAMFID